MRLVAALLLLLSVAAAADFTITTTANFDAGTKSNSSGNYEVETYTDNYNITANGLQLGNRYSDRFTFADANGLTWKWVLGNDVYWGDEALNGMTIEVDSGYVFYYLDDANDHYALRQLSTNNLTGDFSWTIRIKTDDKNIEADRGLGLQRGDRNDFAYTSFSHDAGGAKVASGIFLDDAELTSGEAYVDTDEIDFKYARVGDNLTIYYDQHLDGTWTMFLTTNSWSTTTVHQILWGYKGNMAGGEETTSYTRSVVVGTLNGLPYRTTGNWTSATQTMTGTHLNNMTINYTNPDAGNYIDRIDWLVGGIVVANYTTDINSGTSATILAPTGGSFEYVNSDFQVRLLLVGDGDESIVIEELSGLFYTAPAGGTTTTTITMPSGVNLVTGSSIGLMLLATTFCFAVYALLSGKKRVYKEYRWD